MKPRRQTPSYVKKKRIESGGYPIDQCAIYKLRSKGRLASLLGFDLARLRELSVIGLTQTIINI